MAFVRETSERSIVGVWYDETPEPEYRAWVVADETIDEHGAVIPSDTGIVSVHADQHEAIAEGRRRAEERGVPFVFQPAARSWGN